MLRMNAGHRFSRLWLVTFFSAAVLAQGTAHASPWVETDDPLLRVSIQQLADAGYLRGTTTSYPLMWSGIARDLRSVNVAWLTDDERFAYYRVRSALQFAQQRSVRGIRLAADSDEQRPSGFAGANVSGVQQAKGSLAVSSSFTSAHTAGRLRTTFRANSADDNSVIFDGSYLASVVGNWAVSLDQMPVWWGPGNETALVSSTQSRPVQALRLSRLGDHASEIPVLDSLGHWHLTGFVGRVESDGWWSSHMAGGARLTLRPLSWVQLGASYTQHWGSTVLTYQAQAADTKRVTGTRNQLAAVDARLALPRAFALYAEVAKRVGEHAVDDGLAYTIGADHYLGLGPNLHQVYVEATKVPSYFYDDYAFEFAQGPVRGQVRAPFSVPSATGQDATALSLGYKHQRPDGSAWQVTLRRFDRGADNEWVRWQSVRSANGTTDGRLVGNDGYEVELDYQRAWGDALVRLGATVTRNTYHSATETGLSTSGSADSEVDASVRAALEFRF